LAQGEKKIPLATARKPHNVEIVIAMEISRMSVTEKLKLMDVLWDDLSATPDQVELPTWHVEELENTKARRKLGLEEPMTLEQARARVFATKNDS
jgi:hypothetical protein